MGPDGTAGNVPRGTIIEANFAYRCGRKIVILSRFVTLSPYNPKSITISVFEKQSSFYFQAKSHANLIKDNIFVRPFLSPPPFCASLTCARFGSSTGPEQE